MYKRDASGCRKDSTRTRVTRWRTSLGKKMRDSLDFEDSQTKMYRTAKGKHDDVGFALIGLEVFLGS